MSKPVGARELAFRLLFQVDVAEQGLEEVLTNAREEVQVAEDEWKQAERMVRETVERQSELDAHIRALSSGWSLERLARVDRTLLRLALCELIHHSETPAAVVINDAVQLARRYSTEDSPRFVNGILGNFHRSRLPLTAQAEANEELK